MVHWESFVVLVVLFVDDVFYKPIGALDDRLAQVLFEFCVEVRHLILVLIVVFAFTERNVVPGGMRVARPLGLLGSQRLRPLSA